MSSEKSQTSTYLNEINLDLSDLSEHGFFHRESALFYDESLFLGRFDNEAVIGMLEECGVLRGIRDKGYADPQIRLDLAGSNNQRLIITDSSSPEMLVFMRLHPGEFLGQGLIGQLSHLRLLFIDWLLLQHPLAPVQTSKLFPGQKFPGLGIFREIKDFITMLVKQLHLDGAANLPEFFHDAVLFADRFKFVSPESQALFDNARKQLRSMGLRQLTKAISDGEISVETGGDRRKFDARLGEMLAENCDQIRGYFASAEYRSRYESLLKSAVFFRDQPANQV